MDTSLPKLDQALSSLQADLQAAGLGALDPLTTELEQTRSQPRRGFAALSQFPPPMTAHRNVEIPVADYRIRCRIYWPTPAKGCPVLVYVHGGGWFFGDVSTHDRIARELARADTKAKNAALQATASAIRTDAARLLASLPEATPVEWSLPEPHPLAVRSGDPRVDGTYTPAATGGGLDQHRVRQQRQHRCVGFRLERQLQGWCPQRELACRRWLEQLPE